MNNGRGNKRTKKEKEVLTKREKKLKRNRLMSMKNHEIVHYPISQFR